MTLNLSPYEKEWVALTPEQDKVLEHGKDLKEVVLKIKNTRIKNPIFLKVLSTHETLSPVSYE